MKAVHLLLTTLLLADLVWAQSDIAIVGTATDPSGAMVPGATVTAANTATGIAVRTNTDEKRDYRSSLLNPGIYNVAVQASGFNRAEVQGITLNVGDVHRTDFSFQGSNCDRTSDLVSSGFLRARHCKFGLATPDWPSTQHQPTTYVDPVTGMSSLINLQGNARPNAIPGPPPNDVDYGMGNYIHITKRHVSDTWRGVQFIQPPELDRAQRQLLFQLRPRRRNYTRAMGGKYKCPFDTRSDIPRCSGGGAAARVAAPLSATKRARN